MKSISFLLIPIAASVLRLEGSGFVLLSPPSLGRLVHQAPLTRAKSLFATKTDSTSNNKTLSRDVEKLETILQDKRSGKSKYQKIVVQTAPAARVSLPELYGDLPGTYDTGILVASLKALGFDVVLDTNTAADLTICEEATELLSHMKAMQENASSHRRPLFTSCCPGWLIFLEKSAPELIPYLSSCKSPMMMYGAVIKRNSKMLFGLPPEEICSVAVMPCVAKRQESDRPIFTSNGTRDVDLVITTKEIGTMLKLHDIDPRELDPMPFDSPFQNLAMRANDNNPEQQSPSGLGTGAGQLFGATGGVMEASLRSVYELVTGSRLPRLEFDTVRGFDGLKEAIVSLYNEETGQGIPHMDLKIAVVNGLANAKTLIQSMKESQVSYDYIEVMACPGGCIGGGGQRRCADKATREQRLETIYMLDRSLPTRRSHENPDIIRLYDQVLGGEYGSKEAHKQLHVKEQVYGGPESVAS